MVGTIYPQAKGNDIIQKMKNRVGIEIPKIVEEAYHIDKDWGTYYWIYDIKKEMKTVQVSFDFKDEVHCDLVGYQYIT